MPSVVLWLASQIFGFDHKGFPAFRPASFSTGNIIELFPKNFSFMVNAVITARNFPYVEEIARYLAQKEVKNINLSLAGV